MFFEIVDACVEIEFMLLVQKTVKFQEQLREGERLKQLGQM